MSLAVLHLSLLLLSLVVSGVLIVRDRATGLSFGRTVKRLFAGIAAGVGVTLIPTLVFLCTCGPGNNPTRQAIVPGIGALACALAGGSARTRALGVGLMLLFGLGLSWHFERLVLPADPSICRFTGDAAFVRNSCSSPSVFVEHAWYTPLTGLYPLRLGTVR